ncbi:MAG: diguanylate cyclase [Oscillatoria sp. PMC 1068.18]|nr:diguanylate cyclase [Oscillatoria sp. PMC 1076.18]MEC4990628.1 diguanylate cyclase [Oscillatoria sp. PMC 1068.18]
MNIWWNDLSKARFEAIAFSEKKCLLQVNPSFTELFGYEAEEAKSLSVGRLVLPRYRQQLEESLDGVRQASLETVCQQKDGTTFAAQISWQTIAIHESMIQVLEIRDLDIAISSVKSAQRSPLYLQQLVSLLYATLNSTTDGILAVCNHGENLIFNRRFREMWKLSEAEVNLADRDTKFAFLRDRVKNPEKCLQEFQEVERKPLASVNTIIELKDGRIFELNSEPQQCEGGVIGRVWNFHDLTDTIKSAIILQEKNQREQLINAISQRIRQSLNLQEILETTASEVRQLLNSDRVVIYQFSPDWSGKIAVESVVAGIMPILGREIYDPCFGEKHIQSYRKGRIHTVYDIYQDELIPCYRKFLATLHVRANLALPILQEDKLWGLLIAHDCQKPRKWEREEINLLQSLATQVAIAIQQASLFERLETANRELQRLAAIDGLTKLANRRRFDEHLSKEWERMKQQEKPLSLILGDVDHFKLYNDNYGHLAGDVCLQKVAQALSVAAKYPRDLVARYGGEEFAIILPETEAKAAQVIAEKILAGVRNLQLTHAYSSVAKYVSVSLGICTLIPSEMDTPEDLIKTADKALYQAKESGRDRYVLIPDQK